MACGWPRGSLGGSPGRYSARSAENSGFEICRILPCPRTYFHERIRCRLDSAPTKQFAALQPGHPYAEAHIQKHVGSAQKPPGQYPSTVAFLVHVNSLPGVDETPGLPCGLVACFGMDGYSTLIWSRIVRLRYPQLLTKPGFVMAELTFRS